MINVSPIKRTATTAVALSAAFGLTVLTAIGMFSLDNTIDLLPATVAPPGTFTDRLVGDYGSPHANIASFQVVYRFGGRRRD